VNAVDALKLLGGPGSLRFLALASLAGAAVIYFWPRFRKLARAWLATLFVTYTGLALPFVAGLIAAPLEREVVRDTSEPLTSDDLLVVFSGDNPGGRAREAARVWREVRPAVVLVSGEQWFVTRLLRAGVPSNRLTIDSTSTTTRDQVDYLESFLQRTRRHRAAVIVSRLQAPRVAALLRARHLTLSVIPAAADREPASVGWKTLFPTPAALFVSRDALYERMALWYYRRRGWIATS
jgi:uncharacterized SAM-binding protein YcdF (DUF218 family)